MFYQDLKQKMPRSVFSLFVMTALLFSFSVYAGDMHHLRGKRYCEILLSVNRIPKQMQVYNTIGLNDCPQDVWNNITPEKIKQETGASFVRLNGPRYWMIDGLQSSHLINLKERVLGGIAMREAGVLNLRLLDIFPGQKPYQKHNIHRQTTWIYKSGKPIYELIDPKGKVYVMQSFSVQKVEQTEAGLSQLGTKLHLPKNWSFRTRMLSKDAHLTPINEIAVVVQDDYLNTYQEETPDFIAESGA